MNARYLSAGAAFMISAYIVVLVGMGLGAFLLLVHILHRFGVI